METKIKIKVKNNYRFNRLKNISKNINVVLRDEKLFLYLNEIKLIEIDSKNLIFFDKNRIRSGARYEFQVLNCKELQEETEFEFQININEKNINKKIIAQKLIREFSAHNKEEVGIYLLKIDDINYIGQSKSLSFRIRNHMDSLCEGIHANEILQTAWNIGFEDISFQVLELLVEKLDAVEQQEWLASKEMKYIKEYSGKNIANKTKGELIVTRKSYDEYSQKKIAIEKTIRGNRKLRIIEMQKRLNEISSENNRLNHLINEIDEKIKEIKNKKSLFEKVNHAFGEEGSDEKLLIERRNNYISKKHRTDEIYDLNFKISQLKKRKFTEEEVGEMEKMGRFIKKEYSNFRK